MKPATGCQGMGTSYTTRGKTVLLYHGVIHLAGDVHSVDRQFACVAKLLLCDGRQEGRLSRISDQNDRAG
jgi:hypothetical protein